jgi:hypothetical protein
VFRLIFYNLCMLRKSASRSFERSYCPQFYGKAGHFLVFLNCLTLKMKLLGYFETSEYTRTKTQLTSHNTDKFFNNNKDNNNKDDDNNNSNNNPVRNYCTVFTFFQ